MSILTQFSLFGLILLSSFSANAQIWDELAKLNASDAQLGDHFGYEVCVHENRAIIGANFKDSTDIDTGGGYIFEKIDNIWTQVAILSPPELTPADFLGEEVAIYGDIAVLASGIYAGELSSSGVAYVFEFAGGEWIQTAILQPELPVSNGSFGIAVTIYENTILIGEPGKEKGMAHVYEKVDGS